MWSVKPRVNDSPIDKELGVAITTAFRGWHHFPASPTISKISEVFGIVEADEMFFFESYKGKRTIHHREPRKHGGMCDKRKKEDQTAVLTDKDSSGGLTETMLGRPTKEKIGEALKPIINTDSILCSDGAHSYRSFAKENGLTHYHTIASKSQRVIGKQPHIQNVNNYMMCTRGWMQRFHGVGTDYLPNYLGGCAYWRT
ncbi:IS1595 family transposase [Vibrio sp. WZ-1]|uniref:IS1595 family transposase n=1 Tax=Vibrio sp. WZ-1 TaxID=3454501 RepID=UPI003F8301E1